MINYFAYSLSGNDKGKVYYICKEEKKFLWICDGKKSTLENPIKKNRKHIQLIKKYSLNEMFTISDKSDISNEEIKMACENILKDIQEV